MTRATLSGKGHQDGGSPGERILPELESGTVPIPTDGSG